MFLPIISFPELHLSLKIQENFIKACILQFFPAESGFFNPKLEYSIDVIFKILSHILMNVEVRLQIGSRFINFEWSDF